MIVIRMSATVKNMIVEIAMIMIQTLLAMMIAVMTAMTTGINIITLAINHARRKINTVKRIKLLRKQRLLKLSLNPKKLHWLV